MCRSLRKWITLAAALLLLCGCAAENGGTAQLLHRTDTTEVQPDLVTAELGTIRRKAGGLLSCEPRYQKDEQLLCTDVAGLLLEECYVSEGEQVQVGQPLAKFVRKPDARAQEQLQNAVKVAQLALDAEKARLDGAVNSAKAALDACTPGTPEAKIAALRLEKAYYAANNQDHSALLAAEEALETFEAQLAGVELTAPFAGTVEHIMRMDGKEVVWNTVFCRLFTHDAVYLLANSVNESAYRYHEQVTVQVSAEDYCTGTVCSSAEVFGVVNADVVVIPEEGVDLTKLTQPNVGVTVTVTRLQLDAVLRVPKKAIRSEGGAYYVYLYADGVLHRRSVQIGLEGTDPQSGETYVQILEGLNAGDQIAVG